MTECSLHVIGLPQPQGNKTGFNRGGKIVLVEGRTPESRRNFQDWREAVRLAACEWINDNWDAAPFSSPLSVSMNFWLPRPKSAPKRVTHHVTRPDLDKLARGVLDALTISGLIVDDSYVVSMHCAKQFAIDRPPGAMIVIHPFGLGDTDDNG